MKPILKNKIAHGIVGWNYFEYMSNAIDSVLCNRMRGEPLFVVVTGGSQESFNLIIEKYLDVSDFFISYVAHDSSYPNYTGSLYHGNKQLFTQVKNNGFQYLNLIQSDLQLLWWDQDILAHYLLILKYFKNSFQIYTGSPKRGANPSAYEVDLIGYKILEGGEKIHFLEGLSDWGFFDLDRWSDNGFYWHGHEGSMCIQAQEKGLVCPFSRLPCVADIPWPVVVRGGHEVGIPVKRTEMLLLKGTHEDTLNNLKTSKSGILWQEDWVKTWGWWALEPTWNTEFTYVYPIRIIKSIFLYKNFKYAWSSYGKRNRLFPPFGNIFKPNGSDLMRMITGLIYIIIHRIFSKLLHYLKKLRRL